MRNDEAGGGSTEIVLYIAGEESGEGIFQCLIIQLNYMIVTVSVPGMNIGPYVYHLTASETLTVNLPVSVRQLGSGSITTKGKNQGKL